MAEIRQRVRDLSTPRRDPMQDRMVETLKILNGDYNAKVSRPMTAEERLRAAYVKEKNEPCFLCGGNVGEQGIVTHFNHPDGIPGAATIYGLCRPCALGPDAIKRAELELMADLTDTVEVAGEVAFQSG